MQSMQSRGLIAAGAVLRDKSGGRSSAQAMQRSVFGEKRDTHGAQTCRAGQLRHTAHWLTSEGSENGRLNFGATKRLNTQSIYSLGFVSASLIRYGFALGEHSRLILKIHDNNPTPSDP